MFALHELSNKRESKKQMFATHISIQYLMAYPLFDIKSLE